jgi:hypothetical protein
MITDQKSSFQKSKRGFFFILTFENSTFFKTFSVVKDDPNSVFVAQQQVQSVQ